MMCYYHQRRDGLSLGKFLYTFLFTRSEEGQRVFLVLLTSVRHLNRNSERTYQTEIPFFLLVPPLDVTLGEKRGSQ